MGQAAFSNYSQYVLDIDCDVQSQNQGGNFSTIYWRVLVYKTSGSGYQSGNPYSSGWARQRPSGAYVWNQGGFGYDFRTTSGIPVGGYVMFAQGTFTLPHNSDGYASYAVDGAMSLEDIGSANAASGNKDAPRIPKAPGAPTGVSFFNVTQTSMRTKFSGTTDGGSKVREWQLQRATDASFTQNLVKLVSTGTDDHTGLTPKTTYYFRPRGRNDIGWGAWGATKSQATLDVPNKPATPAPGTVTPSSIPLTTTDPATNGSAITAREVQLSLSETFATIVSTKTTASPTFGASDGVVRARTYYVRWRVQNGVGWSAYSDTLTVQTPGTVPSAPTDYSAYDIAVTSATVSLGTLADNGGATPNQVRVKISTTASDTGLIQTVTRPQWAPVPITGLTGGETYYVAQAAYNTALGGGWGAYGAWVPFTMRSDVPNAPVVTIGTVGPDYGTVQWTTPTQLNGAVIASYKIRVATDDSISQNVIEEPSASTDISRIMGSLTAGKTYYAVVWTETDKGRGSSSAVVSFTTTGGGGSSQDLWMNVLGVWKQIELWMNVAGVWKSIELWQNVLGTWKKLF